MVIMVFHWHGYYGLALAWLLWSCIGMVIMVLHWHGYYGLSLAWFLVSIVRAVYHMERQSSQRSLVTLTIIM